MRRKGKRPYRAVLYTVFCDTSNAICQKRINNLSFLISVTTGVHMVHLNTYRLSFSQVTLLNVNARRVFSSDTNSLDIDLRNSSTSFSSTWPAVHIERTTPFFVIRLDLELLNELYTNTYEILWVFLFCNRHHFAEEPQLRRVKISAKPWQSW